MTKESKVQAIGKVMNDLKDNEEALAMTASSSQIFNEAVQIALKEVTTKKLVAIFEQRNGPGARMVPVAGL